MTAAAWLKPGLVGSGVIDMSTGDKTVTGHGAAFVAEATAGGYLYVSKPDGTAFYALLIDTITDNDHLELVSFPPAEVAYPPGREYNLGTQSMPVTIGADKSEDGHIYIINPGKEPPYKVYIPGPAVTEATAGGKFTTTTAPTPPVVDYYDEPTLMEAPNSTPIDVVGQDGHRYHLIPYGVNNRQTVPGPAVTPAVTAGWSIVP